MTNILDRITMMPMGPDQYVNTVIPNKRQIFIHHTASSSSPRGVLKYWNSTPEKVGTAFVVGGAPPTGDSNWKDGDIIQCFNSACWSWHLGLTANQLAVGAPGQSNNTDMNKLSIGIELCSWGQLTKTSHGWSNYTGGIVPDNRVVEYDTPYKSFTHYEKYTDAQLDTTKQLIQYLAQKYNIPTTFKGMSMFDVDVRCLRGESGIWTHTSCRPDKFDCHPQKELIDMLQSL